MKDTLAIREGISGQDDEKANDQEEEINRLQNELIQLAESKSSLELQVAALSKEVETSQSKLLEVKHNDSEEIRSLKNDSVNFIIEINSDNLINPIFEVNNFD